MANKKTFLKTGFLYLCIFFVIAIAGLLIVSLIMYERRYEQRRVRLLCETDYKVLLNACRELSNRTTIGKLKPGYYWICRDEEPKASQFGFPEVILNVEPIYAEISSEGWVLLEMGGIPYYGLIAYPDDSDPIKNYSFHGSAELIPGLWYYDEDYPGQSPDYDKKINALIQDGKKINRIKAESKNNTNNGP